MQRPRQPFRNRIQSKVEHNLNKDTLKTNLSLKRGIRGKSDSYHSYAPETTYIIKRNFWGGSSLILVASFFLFFTIRGLLKFGFNLFTICILICALTVLIWGIYLIVKSALIDSKSNKEHRIILSKEGINLEGVFFNWSLIRHEKLLREGFGRSRRYYLYFEIPDANRIAKYPLINFDFNNYEFEYLLTVYRSRYENKIIWKKEKFEEKYKNMPQQKKDKYILG